MIRVMATVLIVDDEDFMRDSLGAILSKAGHGVVAARDGLAAEKKLDERSFDCVITDLKMPRMDGLELLKRVRARGQTPVIVVTAHGTIDTAIEAMKAGAADFVQKPFGAEEILARLDKALGLARLQREAANLRELASEQRPMIGGESSAMRELKAAIERMAQSDATVLIAGESGTGKEVTARAIHAASPRRQMPFVAVNCAALSAGLLESELFGHEKGAFTGAERQRKGRFELAEGGTLLLDEVSEIDPGLQAKLLRVLQERVFERVGSSEPVVANVRVIATTNRDLAEHIRAGKFREDLYFRLNVLPLKLPALRERREEILPLARHFLERHARKLGRVAPRLSPDGEAALKAYRWPGNVRELENTLERLCVLESGQDLNAGVLERYLSVGGGGATAGGFAGYAPGVVPSLEDVERDLMAYALKTLGGDKNLVAEKLGITTKTLRAKIRKWKLQG
ncbi:MAG TPA: sigma-54 dependent transcriptional regulator [Planctomycetota bacterium]|nr:sigma-54 dependent transcriptional regulator [Planctomycetota bacterium]